VGGNLYETSNAKPSKGSKTNSGDGKKPNKEILLVSHFPYKEKVRPCGWCFGIDRKVKVKGQEIND
jgi:hypothetical protein